MADTADQKKSDKKSEQRPEPRTEQKSEQRPERRSQRRAAEKKPDHRSEKKSRRRLPAAPAWWPLPVCAVLGLAAGGAYGVLKAPEYAATSYVVAVPDETTEPATALGFAQAYARIATSSSTLAYAQPRAGLTARQLRTQVRAETSPESPMIAITGTSKSPSEAADVANAVADALSLSSNQAAKNTGVQLLLFSQAVAPAEPASPSAAISGAVGMCAGGLLGGLWLLARPGRSRRPEEHADGPVAQVQAPVQAVAASPAESAVTPPVEEYASLPAQGEPTSAKEKESVR
ncbi:lipopolysaccharide biosynthesis protein [Streptomyces sp. MB09-01]|uniref:lipopolysaccharide biosynthesis protein n=1 Tax=Streptomyces sp. MB09-01 TaxID=3028666 RepID=UPI0029B4B10D|nr:lipopolysaccharide biosynthesis protein [Streptomyces sp. MB09-01]MDX3540247.1 lipopolysaccharide biosynthesis protein [Streptomyces sp. MB09-01]